MVEPVANGARLAGTCGAVAARSEVLLVFHGILTSIGVTGGSVEDTPEGSGWAGLTTGGANVTAGKLKRGTVPSPGSTPNGGDPMEDAGKGGICQSQTQKYI